MNDIKQSHDSDIEIRVTLKDNEGNPIDASKGMIGWELRANRVVFAGNTGTTPLNCYIDNGVVVLVVPANTFVSGELSLRIMTIEPNEHFPDATKDVWSEWQKINLMIV